MSRFQQIVQSTRFHLKLRRALAATIVLGYLVSCSLQEFDKLGPGKSSARGAAGSGGRKIGSGGGNTAGEGESGATSVGGTQSGSGTSGAAGFAGSAATGGAGAVAGTEGVSGSAGQAGAPSAACGAGFSSCPGEPVCTTNLTTGTPAGATVNHCGTCGLSCSVVNATGAACNHGQCVPTCSAGFLDCNAGAKNDGCELYVYGASRCGTTCTNVVTCPETQICNAGTCSAPQGVVALSVPLTAAGQAQRFADRFPTKPNLTNGMLTVRLYAPGAVGGEVNVYPADGEFTGGNGIVIPLTVLSAGWVDIQVQLAGVAGDFDPITITQVNIEIESFGEGPWLNPTLVYVDRVWSSVGGINDNFDATIGNMVGSSLLKIDGSTFTWMSAVP